MYLWAWFIDLVYGHGNLTCHESIEKDIQPNSDIVILLFLK